MISHNDLLNYLQSKTAVITEREDNGLLEAVIADRTVAFISPARKSPVQISLRCDPVLAASLIASYESVMPGRNLNQKKWITLVLSGQVSDGQVFGLIDHSIVLAANE